MRNKKREREGRGGRGGRAALWIKKQGSATHQATLGDAFMWSRDRISCEIEWHILLVNNTSFLIDYSADRQTSMT